jgi:hypothetical protein
MWYVTGSGSPTKILKNENTGAGCLSGLEFFDIVKADHTHGLGA